MAARLFSQLRMRLAWALACLLLTCGARAAMPAVALYYGHEIPLGEFRAFDLVVVDPDHPMHRVDALGPATKVYAYVSVTEVQPSRAYHADIPAEWKLARNQDWQSEVVDQSVAAWPEFFASRVVAPLWERGFRGFFLDTLDSYRLASEFDEQAQQRGLVRVIETLHQRFPGIRLILNRGFDILPQLQGKVEMVAAESLYQRWNAKTRRYEEVPPQDRQWLMEQLRTLRQRDGLPVLVIDYVAPQDRALTRATAQKIQQDGFIPWVTDAQLTTIGIGSIEPVARRVLVLYNGGEAPALDYTNAHRYLQMPLNHMGYVTDYVDVRGELPRLVAGDRYAGVVSWFSGFIAAPQRAGLSQWLQARMREGMPLAVVGDWGLAPDRALARSLGLVPDRADPQGTLRQVQAAPMMGFENPLPLPSRQNDLVQLTPDMARQSQSLVELRDARDRSFVGGAITPWGGFVLDPNVLFEIPGTDEARWLVDPFAFLQQALRLPAIPVPDTTTENGRRLLLAHVDGDGFPSLAEFPGSPLAAQVLLTEVFEKYRIPQTMSVIEAEVAPDGLYPALSPRMEEVARKMFRLPHIEVGNHSYSHPFQWDTAVQHGIFTDNSEAARSLAVPGYTMNLEREIVGSTRYINERLAPRDKPVKIFQWSGDTAPSAEALALSYRAGLLNINGGDTSISRTNPSLTAVGALGLRKGGLLQVYAPITNENIYTHLWTGPYYGFERVIESFEMTDTPRRIKPVGIYYHSYSASKPASLKALKKVYNWALDHPLHPVHASEFIAKVQDFYDYAMARDGDGWRLRSSNGALRTVRLPAALGLPRTGASQAVAGWRPGVEGRYVHLSGPAALLQTNADETSSPYLHEANARLVDWQADPDGRRLQFTLQGHVPLEFALANTEACQVRANQRPLTALRPAAQARTAVQQFKLPDAAAQIQVLCR
ncbi:MAG: endo alpha-1,4 polygalactosaminidase [Proteobacteria bacterium]|nr:endo alpha-1,4 polygalactosaminidase [Pseudomonadota bacterium]